MTEVGRVTRRIVFYLPGFDPRGAMFYHHLYAAENAKQAAINGLEIGTGKRQTVDEAEARWELSTASTTTQYRFLRYEDIVRRQWPKSAAAMYGGILRYAWHFSRMGVYRAIFRNSWPSFVAVIYPPLVLAGLLAAALLIGFLAALVLRPTLGEAAFLAVLPALALPFAAYRPMEKYLNAFWLARSCVFLVDRSLAAVPGIEDRCQLFARRLADAVNAADCDEVLLVGHSVGTHLAVTVAARAIERIDEGRRFSLLTLGQAIAMTPDEPLARVFRDDLLRIALSPKVNWIDVTSAIDGSCIALSDPLDLSGVMRPSGSARQPKLVSARFNKLFTPHTYAAMRRNFLHVHFQYLMAAELAGDYDYFLITAGDKTLQARFAHLESVTDFNRFRLGKT